MTYISRSHDLIERKKPFPKYETILHSNQGSVYASKKCSALLPMYNMSHSMSRAGTPADNAAMEAINGWIKTKLFNDFHMDESKTAEENIEYCIRFFNEERPAYALNYFTPRQYREAHANSEVMR